MLALTLLVAGCSSTLLNTGGSETLELLPADEIKQGPGVFSGEDGGFFFIKDLKKKPSTEAAPTTTPSSSVDKMNLDETSRVLEDKIKQLEKDRIELELLKSQIDKKIQAQ